MPMFEFQCHECGKDFERLVFASETGKVACPHCGSEQTGRKLSVFARAGRDAVLAGGSSHTCSTTGRS
jgi:putative FmdB family regulatory protein